MKERGKWRFSFDEANHGREHAGIYNELVPTGATIVDWSNILTGVEIGRRKSPGSFMSKMRKRRRDSNYFCLRVRCFICARELAPCCGVDIKSSDDGARFAYADTPLTEGLQ